MEMTPAAAAATATAPSRPPAGVQKRRKPSGETSHVCPFCQRAFKRSEHKERHVRTHTKEKPFVCHCGSAFTRRDLLTRHQRIATHEKIQDVSNTIKLDQSGVPPAVDVGPELTSPISPSDIGMTNPWDQQSHLNSFYHASGSGPEDQHILHHLQQPILPQEYYQGHEFQSDFGDFSGLTQYDDSGLPLGWNATAYFQPSDTGEDYLDPQLQETISISI